MNYKHLSIALFIVAALLLPGVINGAWTGYEAYQAQKQANQHKLDSFSVIYDNLDRRWDRMLDECKGKHDLTQCKIDFLKRHGDYVCDDGLCCGGNSVGWFECF